MKTFSHILQPDHLYKYGIGLFIAVLSLFHTWLFLGLIVYIYFLRKQINILFFCFLFLLIYVPFNCINEKIDKHIDETLIIVDIDDYDTYQRVTVKKNFKKYHIYTYEDEYLIGDVLWVSGAITPYQTKTNVFGFDAKKYFLSHGVYGKIEIQELRIVDHRFHINSLRSEMINKDQTHARQYLNAFLFGEQIQEESVKSIYEDFNIIYMFTISGMHIYFLVLLLKKVMFYLNMRENYQHGIILVVLIFISFLYQFHYAVLRVLFIYVLRIINQKYKLQYQQLDLIFISFYMMILLNMHYIYHQGFLMTLIILFTIELLHPFYHSLGFYLKQLMMTVIITLVILPFFSEIYVLQILCLPVFVFIIIYILYPLSILASISVHFFNFFDVVIKIFERLIASLSLKQIDFFMPQFNIYMTLVYYILFIWIFLGKYKWVIFKRTMYAAITMSMILMFQVRSYDERIIFLDVGQGDTTIIQTESCHMVIDSFKGTLDYLKHHGIYHLDYLILTHNDEDHILEAEDIIEQIDVDQIVVSKYDQNYPAVYQPSLKVSSTDRFVCGQIDLKVLGPLKAYENDNNNSVVLQFVYNHQSFLFTGDIEKEAEEDLIEQYHMLLKSDVIKVPHHGSITSSSESFLSYVNPSYAIFSLKSPNRYGFPSDDVLLRYINDDVIIYRTDLHGTIIYHGKKRKEKWSVYLSI